DIQNVLGGLDGADFSVSAAVNDNGTVVGTYTNDDFGVVTHGFVWAGGTAWTDPGTLGGPSTAPTAVNNARPVVGISYTPSGASHAFLWTASGGMLDIGTLGGTLSSATGINNAGQIVGWSRITGDSNFHAFLYTLGAGGGMLDLGTLGGTYSQAYG